MHCHMVLFKDLFPVISLASILEKIILKLCIVSDSPQWPKYKIRFGLQIFIQ